MMCEFYFGRSLIQVDALGAHYTIVTVLAG
jgi:hypothetical protein